MSKVYLGLNLSHFLAGSTASITMKQKKNQGKKKKIAPSLLVEKKTVFVQSIFDLSKRNFSMIKYFKGSLHKAQQVRFLEWHCLKRMVWNSNQKNESN